MTRILLLLGFVLLITNILAVPTRSLHKRSFKVHREELRNYVPNGKVAIKRAYLKFGLGDIAFKPNGEAAARIKSASNLAADNDGDASSGTEDGETTAVGTQNDAQFLSPVYVGGQKLIMNFDSGSADFWVFNTNLPPAARQGHDIYDPSKSANFKQLNGATYKISYGDGSYSSGPVGIDQVDIGGSTVDQQAIGLPNNISRSFATDSTSSGLVGLAFSSLNTVKPQQQRTFFDNIVSDLSLPLFTASLKGGTVGSYEFGRIDDTAYKGQLAQVPIDSSKGFWEFDSATATVGGQTIKIPNGKAMADTGTSLMLVQDNLLTGYWVQVTGAYYSQDDGGYIFPCKAELPDLSVAVGPNYMAKVPGSFMNFADAGTDPKTGTEYCFGGLQSNSDLPFAIFGDVWFKSQFVVFQATGPSLGIAPHA